MAVRGISKDFQARYVLSMDPAHPEKVKLEALRAQAEEREPRDLGQPTVFLIRRLSTRLMAVFNDRNVRFKQVDSESGISVEATVNQNHYEMARIGLAGWEGPFPDENGNQLVPTFEKIKVGTLEVDALTDEAMGYIGLSPIAELVRAIDDANMIKAAEAKS